MIKAKWDKKVDKLFQKIDKFSIDCGKQLIQATQLSTLLIHENAVKGLQETSGGDTAIRYNPKRNVTVSKPGDAPNTDTGRAVQSIKWEFIQRGETYVGRVGTNLRYLRDLEFGTKNIAPRPWLTLAVEKSIKGINKIFKDAMTKSVKGSGK